MTKNLSTFNASKLTPYLIAIAILLSPIQDAKAASPSCHYVSQNLVNASSETKIKINYQLIENMGSNGLSAMEWKYAVLNAIETWNTYSNGAYFTYVGDAGSDEWHLHNDNLCGQDWNLIRIANSNPSSPFYHPSCGSGYLGNWQTSGICNDVDRWQITICERSDWSVGDIGPNQLDLISTITHEFGHGAGLSHPSNNNTGVMSGLPRGELRQRWLYPWDIQCHAEEYGPRNIAITRYTQDQHSDVISSPITVGTGYSKGAVNVRMNPGPVWSTVGYDTAFRNSTGSLFASQTTNFLRDFVSVGPSVAWLRELPDRWRTYYGYDYSSANRYTNSLSSLDLFQYAYDHDFTPGNLERGTMTSCTAPPSLL